MKKRTLYIIVLICIPFVLSAQNARESASRQLVQALNSSGGAALEKFVDEHVYFGEDEDLKGRWLKFFKPLPSWYGRLTYLKSRIESPGTLAIICKTSKTNAFLNWMKIRLSFDPSSPQKFIKGGASWTDDPAIEVPAGLLSTTQIVKYSQEFTNHLAKEDRFSGTILIAKDGEVMYEDAKGYAVKSRGQKINLETMLNLASATKMFTGVAISQLVEKGQLTYETRLKEVLPFFKNRNKKSEITIHQLLTHSSGLGDFWSVFDRSDRTKIISLTDYFNLVKHDALLFDPGQGKQYSNVGLIVLGLIIEELTGLEFVTYAQKHIFDPAGMKNTGFYMLDNMPDNIAEGYYRKNRNSKNRISNHDHKPIRGSAQGGAYSTIHDMLKFEKALFSGQLVGKKYVDIITTPKIELYSDFHYGYAFQCPTVNGHSYIGHDGGSPGISSEMRMFRDKGLTVIVLSNYSGAADELAEFITGLITRN